MKKTSLLFGFFLIALLFVFSSCNNDDECSLSDFEVNIATVVLEGQNGYSLLLDNGKTLWPAASDVSYLPQENQRVLVNYTILSNQQNGFDHFVKINAIRNLLTKSVIELNAQNEDSIGNDPVKVNAMWVGGDYLNVDFMFNYGGLKPHAINLVDNTLSSSETPNAVDLEFRHNAYGSTNHQLFQGFVCFDLKPFRVETENSVTFKIKVKDWNGYNTYDVVYQYNQVSPKESESATTIPAITSFKYYR